MSERNKHLSCGCCGTWFLTWSGYKDQDQDKGFGICRECQADIEAKNEAMWVELENKVGNSLRTQERRDRFWGFEVGVRRGLLLKMMDDGVIGYQVRSN